MLVLGGRAVLLVDDDRSYVRACARSWRTRCAVVAAHSREEALTIASTTKLHLALVDQHLGGCAGLDLIPEIKAAQPVYTVLISTLMTGELGYLAARYADFVHAKPIEIDVVLAGFERTAQANGPRRYRTPTLDDLERDHARNVLAQCGGNKSQAARVLDISRERLARVLERPSEIEDE
jgi:two-component system response regulator RegA